VDLGIAQFQVRERANRLNLRSGKSIGHAEMLASFANFGRDYALVPTEKALTRNTQRFNGGPQSTKVCRVTPFISVDSVLVLVLDMSDIRPAAVAGTWYSANAEQLAGDVDGYLEAAAATPTIANVV